MSFLRCTASALLLSSMACLGGGDDPQYSLLEPRPQILGMGAVQQLETTRQPGAPPSTVYGRFELSEYAVERFQSLAARITVAGAEPFRGEGIRASWLGEPNGAPIVGHFEGERSLIWAANLLAGGCAEPRCVLSFELRPAAEWNSSLRFDTESLQYELRAWLEVTGWYPSEAQELDGALAISLEEAP